jgi:hypothetical protein
MLGLTDVGCTGFAPVVKVRTIEQAKYEQMWNHAAYRGVAPGEGAAPLFLSQAQPKAGSSIIDFGTGTGRGALMLALFGGLRVEMLDFAENCLDPEVREALQTQAHALRFTSHDLNKPCPYTASYGYCTDVMEHLPPAEVDVVLKNILLASQHVFFQISCQEDSLGVLIGQPLHLSVHPYSWWLKKLQDLDCVVHWSRDEGTHCLFYVTAWQSGESFVNAGALNTTEDEILNNVRANIAVDAAGPDLAWNQVAPHLTNDTEVMILGGGPSLSGFEEAIKAHRSEGVKLITTNGTYNWCLDRGLTPSAQIMVDAREFNKRFVSPVVPECKYLMASQVHPEVMKGLPHDRTLLWHTTMENAREELNARYEIYHAIPGGSSVMLRAIPLLRMLGFRKFHLYGFDSCLSDDAHHAYKQPENDGAMVIDVTCGGRVFKCHPWMVSQAQEFMDLIKFLGDEIEIEVYGDGLIAHILNTGASLSDLDVSTVEVV